MQTVNTSSFLSKNFGILMNADLGWIREEINPQTSTGELALVLVSIEFHLRGREINSQPTGAICCTGEAAAKSHPFTTLPTHHLLL